MPKFLKKAANLGPCCELVFHLWSNFSQWKMMKITYFTSIDDLSRDRTQDQWTTRQAIIPLHHEDKIALSMKFCGFYSACARRENFGCIMNFQKSLRPPIITIIESNSRTNFIFPLFESNIF